MARIGARQQRDYFQNAQLPDGARRKIDRPPRNHVRKNARVQMAPLALHENAAGLLDHPVVVVYPRQAARLCQSRFEFPRRHGFAGQFLPPAAVDEDAPRQIQGRFQPRQFPVEMLPDHESESEQQDGKGIKIKGGIVEGAVLDAAGIRKVSTLPPRQELLAQLVASLESPISGLVGALQGVINEFVYTLQAVADKKAEAQ